MEPMPLISFKSSLEKDAKREDIRQARKVLLEKEKEKYDKAEYRREQAKLRGEDTWMLPSVNNRIINEQKEFESSKSKKRKKEKSKKKKHKKEKEHKRSKHEEKPSDSSDSEDCAPEWVEKSDTPNTSALSNSKDENTSGLIKGPRIERDCWMQAPMDLVPTVTRQELRDRQNKDKEKEDKVDIEMLGQHERELNPYWKQGGSGVPEEKPVAPSASHSGPGDGGVSWLRKAYQRCREQAKEDGRPLEEVAAERWGSLEKLESMLAEAERKEQEKYGHKNTDRYRDRNRPYDRRQERSSYHEKEYRRVDRDHHTGSDRSSDRCEKYSDIDKTGKLKSTAAGSRFLKPEDSESRTDYNKNRTDSNKFRKPGDDSIDPDSRRRSHRERDDYSRDRHDIDNSGGYRNDNPNRDRQKKDYTPGWKKKSFIKPSEIESHSNNKPKETSSKEATSKKYREESSEDSSSSSGSESGSESEAEQPAEIVQQQQPVLSEQQMNELGAKILRAELMGNEDMANELKEKLEAARKAQENQKNMPASAQPSRSEERHEETVVLTRTDRSGMVRPLPVAKHESDRDHRGKRRRKKMVKTHDLSGNRQKYFDDDDQFDLKTLVEREKMGTAEDQNSMFSRLAGRAIEKVDDDFQVDDIFMARATKQQSAAQNEEKDRSLAILEHRKISAAMEKCQHCFENVPKHLIIAIGNKAYLALPNSRSLTEGHCVILPMQHSSCGTSIDEDVWSEIQVFRRCLTKMFGERDEDVVFMETAMHLRKFPHMCVECIPMDKEVGDLAPIYFKKAIQESETEWSQNKKVVDLSQKDVRHAVPKGFPYFSVDFGLQGGFAHVIEDESIFPHFFGKEIVGGMIDAEHRLWRKPQKENFDDQRKKVLQFSEWWKPFDWTQKLNADIY